MIEPDSAFSGWTLSDKASSGGESSEIPFVTFLESVPPGSVRAVDCFFKAEGPSGSRRWVLDLPAIRLHCTTDICDGTRTFRPLGSTADDVTKMEARNTFVTYLCSDCRRSSKMFCLQLTRKSEAGGTAYKYGELPPFGPTTPARLLRLIQPDKDLFLSGRRCETMGLGIGAFAYYRRVVERERNRIFDKLIAVSRRLNASAELIAELEAAKRERKFSESVQRIKAGLPSALLIDGHNPLTLLHTALSDGLHARDEAHCLELARTIRLVLIHLAEKSAQILKDAQELSEAVGKLLKAPRTKSDEEDSAEEEDDAGATVGQDGKVS